MLYIFWILHQATTGWVRIPKRVSCISFESYIKPQLVLVYDVSLAVVYLLNPTSNHNCIPSLVGICTLYIFWILHQTTTRIVHNHTLGMLYIFWILHQTTTCRVADPPKLCCISFESYIKPQLPRFPEEPPTVVYLLNPTSNHNNQHNLDHLLLVVYLLNPTSNHNRNTLHQYNLQLYIFWILHQTTTLFFCFYRERLLYIFWILHQTTTIPR